jgi:Ca-activated chloride channel homolog
MSEANDVTHGEIDQREHERLCAYVFGELSQSERAEFERELAASAALRAEKERLARTLEVVGGVGRERVELPESARAELFAAAGTARAWRPRTTLRFAAAAAGIAAVTLAAIRLARPEADPVESKATEPVAAAGVPVVTPSAGFLLDPNSIYIGRFASKPGISVNDLAGLEIGTSPNYSYYTWRGTSVLQDGAGHVPWAENPGPPALVIPPLILGLCQLQPQSGVPDGGVCANPSIGPGGRTEVPTVFEERPSPEMLESVLASCRPSAGETPRDMYFRFWGDNAFAETRADARSTFAIDQDTASYTLARSYLNAGSLPPPESVRTEEFVNAFPAYVDAPQAETFALSCELAPSRFPTADPASLEFAPQQRWLLACNVRGREVVAQERTRLNLTLVIDVSGSMLEDNRLELVKHSLSLLAGELYPTDTVSLVSFAAEARLALPPTAMSNRAAFESALSELAADGRTNAEAGLVLGYQQAEAMLDPLANNRVVLCSDGVANIGQTEHDALTARVKAWREKGIFLNTIGVGMGNHNDVLLEQLADRGDGVCRYVDSPAEAKKVMVDELVGTLETIARDVKLQVEFDPAHVRRWRLLGYENRAVADADFRNDQVDAGEAQAGRQTTALYELDLGGVIDGDTVIGKLHARWLTLARGEQEAQERTLPIRISHAAWTFDAASAGFRRSALVAQAAEVLRGSVHARGDSLDELVAETDKLAVQLGQPAFDEFAELLKRARVLLAGPQAVRPELQRLADDLRSCVVRLQALELDARGRNEQLLAEVQRESRELEARMRALTETATGAAQQR